MVVSRFRAAAPGSRLRDAPAAAQPVARQMCNVRARAGTRLAPREFRESRRLQGGTMASKDTPAEHLYELLGSFDTAMLVTHPSGGAMHARPMAVAELRPNADAYFVTSIASPKVAELESNPAATLTFQSASKFASVSGRISVARDPALIGRLWKEAWKVWFPQGRDDPSISVLRFEADEGEYWDNAGVQGLKYVFEAAKSYAKGKTPATSRDQNAKVAL
jgi:general stress protein 26